MYLIADFITLLNLLLILHFNLRKTTKMFYIKIMKNFNLSVLVHGLWTFLTGSSCRPLVSRKSGGDQGCNGLVRVLKIGKTPHGAKKGGHVIIGPPGAKIFPFYLYQKWMTEKIRDFRFFCDSRSHFLRKLLFLIFLNVSPLLHFY